MNLLMSNLRNNCKGYGLLNRRSINPYLYNCWWCNKLLTTLQEVKLRKKGVSSEVEASPLPAKFNIPPQLQ